MIISHQFKKAFFRVPKTGSSTGAFMIRMGDTIISTDIATPLLHGSFPAYNTPDYRTMLLNGNNAPAILEMIEAKGGMVQHYTPQLAINAGYITQEQVEEYQVFVCVREPLSRYMSAFKHYARRMPDKDSFSHDILNSVDYEILTRPAVDYAFCGGKFIADLMDFDDFTAEVRRMLTAFNCNIFPIIPRMNKRRGVRLNDTPNDSDYWTSELETIILERFAPDVTLYNAMKAGTI